MRVNDLPLGSFDQVEKPVSKTSSRKPKVKPGKVVTFDDSSDDSDDGGFLVEVPGSSFPEGEGMPERVSLDEALVEPEVISSESSVEEIVENEPVSDVSESGVENVPEDESTIPWQEEVTLPYEMDLEPLSDEETVVQSDQSGEAEADTSAEYQSARDSSINTYHSSSDEDESPLPVRRSNRTKNATEVFQFDRLGGKPVIRRYNTMYNINTT